MLTKITALALVGTVSQAQNFLGTPQQYEVYRVAKHLTENATTQDNMTISDYTAPVSIDLQFKCQYMAGLNFYNLQNLNK